MQAAQPGAIGDAVLGILMYVALVPLAISAGLAIWRAVADYVWGEREATAGAGQERGQATAEDRKEGRSRRNTRRAPSILVGKGETACSVSCGMKRA